MGPCEMPLIEFIVAEQDYEEDDGEEEDYYGGESDLADVAMEEGCTAACQDILGRNSDGVILCSFTLSLSLGLNFNFSLPLMFDFVARPHSTDKGTTVSIP